MKAFEVVIALLLGGAVLAAVARRFGPGAETAAFQRVEEELDWAQFLRTADAEG